MRSCYTVIKKQTKHVLPKAAAGLYCFRQTPVSLPKQIYIGYSFLE